MAGVDCTAATQCTAVGHYVNGQAHALVERLSGAKWKATIGIDPSGASSAALSGVSCFSAASCVAVGTTGTAGLVEQLAHGHWKSTTLALPAGATGAGLNGVSCLSSSPCVAVGAVTESSGSAALMESRVGTSWTSTVDSSVTNAHLAAVSCDQSGTCEGVGGNTFSSLIESGAGTTWTATTTAPGTQLSSVWCDPTGAVTCTAWGILFDNSAVIDSLSGGTWSEGNGPPNGSFSTGLVGSCFSSSSCVAFNQGDAGPAVDTLTSSGWTSAFLSGTPDATLDQVSCSASLCVALGTNEDDTGTRFSFGESLVAGRWQLIPALTSLEGDVAVPASVSCTGAFCAVVGAVGATTTDGVHWTDIDFPSPVINTGVDITGISCVSPGACVAVGSVSESNDELVAEVLQSGTWAAATIALPAGAKEASLSSVSCTALDACVAVGSADTSAGIQSLAEVLAGTTWTGTVLAPAPSATYGDLLSVSCPTASSCEAVGSSYPSFGGDGDPLVENLAAGTWTGTTQVPLSGTSFGENDSVSCSAAGVCDATQLDEGSTGSDWQLESLSAGTWSADAVPPPTGSAVDSPVAVSCAPASWCTVAGSQQSPFSAALPEEATAPLIATLGAPVPSITSADTATVTAGTPFSFTVGTGGPPTAALSESGTLPAGLAFTDNQDGTATIAGTTAVKKGSHPITISADNGLGPVVTQTLTLTCTH